MGLFQRNRPPDRATRGCPVCLTGDIDDGEESLDQDLLPLLDILASHDVKMTVPTTSIVLRTHGAKIARILERGHEVAGHGDVHVAFHDPFEIQVRRLRTMIKDFESHLGVRPSGFRAPYLEHTPDTYLALAATGLRYDSSRVSRDPWSYLKAPFESGFNRRFRGRDLPRIWARHLMGRTDGTPFLVANDVVELPVFEFDDWFFLDVPEGPRLSAEEAPEIAARWLEALKHFQRHSYRALILQAHPVRARRGILEAVDMFLDVARESRCVFMTLSELRNRIQNDFGWSKRHGSIPSWLESS